MWKFKVYTQLQSSVKDVLAFAKTSDEQRLSKKSSWAINCWCIEGTAFRERVWFILRIYVSRLIRKSVLSFILHLNKFMNTKTTNKLWIELTTHCQNKSDHVCARCFVIAWKAHKCQKALPIQHNKVYVYISCFCANIDQWLPTPNILM